MHQTHMVLTCTIYRGRLLENDIYVLFSAHHDGSIIFLSCRYTRTYSNRM